MERFKPRFVRKRTTGALWRSNTPGVWVKVCLGDKLFKTKPVGYVTNQFNPDSPRNIRRFEVVYA